MKFARSSCNRGSVWALSFAVTLLVAPAADAGETGGGQLHFQKPSRGGTGATPASSTTLQFRSTSSNESEAAAPAAVEKPSEPARARAVKQATHQRVAKPLSQAPRVAQAPAKTTARPAFTQPGEDTAGPASYRTVDRVQHSRLVAIGHEEPVFSGPRRRPRVEQASFSDFCLGCTDPACGIVEPACGCGEPTCGICEPECGFEEPACGIEPGCGLEPACGFEPGCGLEPSCACGEPDCGAIDCGSCIGSPGPDYWCFPVCLPRFKELTFWGGVHGFKGPRDAPDFNGAGDNNFGFQEGFNIGGRAPVVGLIFPQLSYQLGFQSVQSQLSGTTDGSTEDRLQNFVTAGLFRRVPAGLQFGAVWDYQKDDLVAEQDFHQMRYEISLKSMKGREIGFWGASATNSEFVGSYEFQAVNQYAGFYRHHFAQGAELRFWGGGTDDSEGLFGADAYAPLNSRWSLQCGFNYLIPEFDPGADAAREESWNVGINLVWHYGKTAKASRTNPHRPLFSVADNGYMFIDSRD